MYDRLTDLLERMVTANRPERIEKSYMVPTFDGKGDDEYLVLRFEEVSLANN